MPRRLFFGQFFFAAEYGNSLGPKVRTHRFFLDLIGVIWRQWRDYVRQICQFWTAIRFFGGSEAAFADGFIAIEQLLL